MHISAVVRNSGSLHEATVATSGVTKAIAIPPKAGGSGSSINGGELLLLALATCYGNDLYREAARLGIIIRGLEVIAEADFNGIGMAATNVRYRARVDSPSCAEEIQRLLVETDVVAEIHNTVRAGVPVVLEGWGQ
jgi:organic hydroperoxide reductase OsmC/OhrA